MPRAKRHFLAGYHSPLLPKAIPTEVSARSSPIFALRSQLGSDLCLSRRLLSVVKDNTGDLLSEDNGFFDEAFGNEWEIVR